MALISIPTPTYEAAPWYIQFAKDFFSMMPAGIGITVIVLAALGYLLRDKLKELAEHLLDMIIGRLRGTSKQPISASELARKGKKKVILDQAAERARLDFRCEHISVYGCQNGVYLRSGEGIDKFLMLSEQARPGIQRHMDEGEQLLLASDVPYLTQALETQPYQLLWAGRCDDWKINKMMGERGYTSSIAAYISRPSKPGSPQKDVIGMYVLSWTDCEVYRADQASTLPASHDGPTRLIDDEMSELLLSYASEFSWLV